MNKYEQQKFSGERAMYQKRNVEFDYCIFFDGESPIKESSNVETKGCSFQWKYPLWYCKDVNVDKCSFLEMARAGIWYTNNITIKDTVYQAPKGIRRCDGVELLNVTFSNAEETLWNSSNIKMTNITAKGDYFGMNSHDIYIDGMILDGNYCFDGGYNITVKNSKFLSKDCFWNADNVTIVNSYISGEYFGWNSRNITLINCTVESEQGMCYMDNLVMKNCRIINTNLAFEYSTVDVEVNSKIDSVKNPKSGTISADSINEIIFDNEDVKRENTVIIERNLNKVIG